MTRPDISPRFTIDDIHKIREWNHARRSGMTQEERIRDINESGARVNDEIAAVRRIRSSALVSEQTDEC